MTRRRPLPWAAAIEVEDLRKSFGRHEALRGIDLRIAPGHVFGLLGPNGAGKTTTVRIVTTLLRADSGRVRVSSHDVDREPDAVRRSIGLSGQFAAIDEKLTGEQNLYLVGRLYGMRRHAARKRAHELLERFRLTDVADRRAGGYSGGMRRRLDLAGAVVAEPPVVVLDEPTTGLDPQGRLDTWDVIGELAAAGSTVLLTTQYLEEADRLADSIAVIDHGTVIARGTADQLKAQAGGGHVEVVVPESDLLDLTAEALVGTGDGVPSIDRVARTVTAPVTADRDGDETLTAVIEVLRRREIPHLELAMRRPTLDDVFLRLTGSTATEEAEQDSPSDEPVVAGAGS